MIHKVSKPITSLKLNMGSTFAQTQVVSKLIDLVQLDILGWINKIILPNDYKPTRKNIIPVSLHRRSFHYTLLYVLEGLFHAV